MAHKRGLTPFLLRTKQAFHAPREEQVSLVANGLNEFLGSKGGVNFSTDEKFILLNFLTKETQNLTILHSIFCYNHIHLIVKLNILVKWWWKLGKCIYIFFNANNKIVIIERQKKLVNLSLLSDQMFHQFCSGKKHGVLNTLNSALSWNNGSYKLFLSKNVLNSLRPWFLHILVFIFFLVSAEREKKFHFKINITYHVKPINIYLLTSMSSQVSNEIIYSLYAVRVLLFLILLLS